jgi:hypothetical protein
MARTGFAVLPKEWHRHVVSLAVAAHTTESRARSHEGSMRFWNNPARFWDKLVPEPNTGCLLWPGSALPAGYGLMRFGKMGWLTHRLSWTLAVGPIPDGMLVCHKCDTPACCNPAHLFIGTIADNNRDAREKGRLSQKVCRAGLHSMDEAYVQATGKRDCRHCARVNVNAKRTALRAAGIRRPDQIKRSQARADARAARIAKSKGDAT